MDDSLLDHLRAAGQADSTGRFTMDPVRALEKLGTWSLADPDRYVVHAVECAVMSGAERIEVRRTRGGCQVQFDGEPFRAADLPELLPGLLQGRWGPADRMHPLAVAVLGALQGAIREVEMETGGTRVRWTRSGADAVPGDAPPDRHVLRVHRAPRRLRDRLFRPTPELDHLVQHCAHCPVPLEAFGRSLSGQLDLGNPLVATTLLSRHPLPELSAVPSGCLGSPSRGPYSAVLTLGSTTLPSGVHVIAAGRRFRTTGRLPAGIAAVVASSAFRTDLGRNALVEDAFHEEVVGHLGEESDRLREVLLRNWFHLGPERSLPHVHQVCLEKATSGIWARAAALAEQILLALPLPSEDGRYSAALYRTALLHQAAGHRDEALAHAGRALDVTPSLGGPHLRCVVDPPRPEEGGPFPYVPMKGNPEDLLVLQTWLWEMGHGILGPDHADVQERRRVTLELCTRHGLPAPDPQSFRDPWRHPDLGGFPPPP